MPLVTIVIVNYKMNAVLLDCLRSIHGMDQDVPFEVIVVDNESDGTLRKSAAADFPQAVIVENPDNAGFAKACNQGMQLGTGDYVLFLNPDTELHPGSLRGMTDFMRANPDVGIIGPITVNTDGSNEPSVYNFPTPWHTLVDLLYLDNVFPSIQGYERKFLPPMPVHEDVQVICGACLFTSRKLLDSIGSFDENLWMYGEDVDLCWRFRKAGFRTVFLKDLKVTHKRGAKHLDENTIVDMSRITYWHYKWIFHFHSQHSGKLTNFIMKKLLYIGIMSKYKPRKKKLANGRNTSRDNAQRVAAYEKLFLEFYGKRLGS